METTYKESLLISDTSSKDELLDVLATELVSSSSSESRAKLDSTSEL